MSAEQGVDVRSLDPIESSSHLQQVMTKELAPMTTPVIRPRQIYGLMAYYTALLAGSIALLVFLVLNEDLILKKEKTGLLATMGFLASGAIVGSILYQIRMLFKYYVKDGGFDPRWLSKYITAPAEAVCLALAVMSLIQSGGAILGGPTFSLENGKPFASFGFGALVGFGIREVVGWVGNLTRTMFSADKPRGQE